MASDIGLVVEPQKHTYASMLHAVRGHVAPLAHRERPITKHTVFSELNHTADPPGHWTVAASLRQWMTRLMSMMKKAMFSVIDSIISLMKKVDYEEKAAHGKKYVSLDNEKLSEQLPSL
ncbi:uncharacterized protein LOC143556100 [Bidens hawaiensis]|uniref:uncharacterized protein LOC143556100 n=1 Tax=Bidens hawaiensis TaxID=980011 RepID=UPI00404A9465